MSKELEIFKKYLGDVKLNSAFEAKQICSQINDANDFIGALQVLDLSLKKISKNIKERLEGDLSEEEKRVLDAQSAVLVQKCSFMGEGLFDNNFAVRVGGANFSFEIANPLLVLEKAGFEGMFAYVEDKQEEIDNLLLDLATAISLDTSTTSTTSFESTRSFGYESLFK